MATLRKVSAPGRSAYMGGCWTLERVKDGREKFGGGGCCVGCGGCTLVAELRVLRATNDANIRLKISSSGEAGILRKCMNV